MGFFIGLCIAAVAGVLVAKDANGRGMNGVGWGLGTFLLCIVFLPLYLIVRRPSISSAISLIPAAHSIRPVLCPSCGKYFEGAAAFCPLCGARQGAS